MRIAQFELSRKNT